ncbi:MAG TPA: hypothetical protein VJV78_38860 [Polyangiales bacterium]|nr:hypothetical protein [Polyangiales bacterium]
MSSPSRRIGRSAWSWLLLSIALHSLCMVLWRAELPPADEPLFKLPQNVEFGLVDQAPGPEGAPAPPPAPVKPVHTPKPKLRVARAAAPVAEAASVPIAADAGPAAQDTKHEAKPDAEDSAAVSGLGLFPDATGSGTGTQGDGTGGVRGAILALNVDVERVKNSALLLETGALLEIIPEWQALLAGSGLDAVRDFRRVFVAAPSADRASLVVSAQHALPRGRIDSAVAALAAERGSPAAFHSQAGISVAAWRNRGPTERVIALTAPDQLVITREAELTRVLSVERALSTARKQQGFDAAEVEARGGLLAMQPDEAVALWVEGLSRYISSAVTGVPESVRLSIFRVDQFHTDLRVAGNYRSARAASEALQSMESLRLELSNHPRVIFLGLKSAMDAAQIEQSASTLRLSVRLTLHQTRYLLGFVSRVFRPRVTH